MEEDRYLLKQDLFVLDGKQATNIGEVSFDQSISKSGDLERRDEKLRLYCLLVLQWLNRQHELIMEGLVLSPVGKFDEYRRVGTFSKEGRTEIWVEKACMKTVGIV
jgi:hypothetical protein